MKIISYTALHYGKEYLYYAIKSVIDHVDEHHILYSPEGSHGHKTDRPCPDTRGELISEASRAAGDKLRWHDGYWPYEGAQRDSIHQYAPDADHIIVVDADEIWQDAGSAIEDATGYNVWQVRMPMIHYWRSFHRAILHDPAYPVRIINTRFAQHKNEHTTDRKLAGIINHMGYAQRPEIVEYKQHTHGHRGEWRQDDWFNTVYMANAQHDCHPVGSDYWNPEPVNPADYMPDFMRQHPYWNREVIE